jgi:hypothetical protein
VCVVRVLFIVVWVWVWVVGVEWMWVVGVLFKQLSNKAV